MRTSVSGFTNVNRRRHTPRQFQGNDQVEVLVGSSEKTSGASRCSPPPKLECHCQVRQRSWGNITVPPCRGARGACVNRERLC
jgi:hypothetical protein